MVNKDIKVLELDLDTEKQNKKQSKGRRRFRSISRTGTFVRLYNGSKMHIEKMVKELRHKDPNFASEAAAVRHYVNVGIAAETATSDLRNSLDNNIVKRSQKDAVREELKPLSNLIENLINTIKENTTETGQLFTDVARRIEIIESKIDGSTETIVNLLNQILLTDEQTLRNLIVLRSINYMYFFSVIRPAELNLEKRI